MPRGHPSLNTEQKEQIIKRVKEQGERAPDLAREYGVNPKIIYNLLRSQVTGPNTLLELAKLKREKEALLLIIGQFILDQRSGKKT